MNRLIITVSPPTPNGDLHLGHLAGPFLSADILKRLAELRGYNVFLVTYSDDYQSYVYRKSREINEEHQNLITKNRKLMIDSLEKVDIYFDNFMQSWNDSDYIGFVTEMYEKAKEHNLIVEKEMNIPFCESTSLYGYEAYARGHCNFCGESSDASQCENCAAAPDIESMGDFTCTISNSKMIFKSVKRECLSLKEKKNSLKRILGKANHRRSLKNFLLETYEQLDIPWPIDRPQEHGVKIEPNNKIIHTWFSGLAGYFASTKAAIEKKNPDESMSNFWFNEKSEVALFFGYDCSYSHAIVYPILLELYNNHTENLYHYSNRFLKLNGDDFSTSRGHAIWIRDIATEYPSDAIRLYISGVSPEDEIKNFSLSDFVSWYENIYLNLDLAISEFIKVIEENKDYFELILKEIGAPSVLAEIDRTLPSVSNFSAYLCYVEFERYSNQFININKSLPVKNELNHSAIKSFLSLGYLLFIIAPNLGKKIENSLNVNFKDILSDSKTFDTDTTNASLTEMAV